MTTLGGNITDRVENAPREPAAPTTLQGGGGQCLAQGEIHTDIAPRTARAMAGLFLMGIFLVPSVQTALELLTQHRVRALDLMKPEVRAIRQLARGEMREAARSIKAGLTKEHLEGFERELEEASLFRQRIQPRVQSALTRYGAFGNSMVIAAREGWLYYQLGLDYLAGPGFLDPSFLSRREERFFEQGEESANADPREAIIRFHDDAKSAGAHLVFMPVPVKEMIEPWGFSGRRRPGEGESVVNNRDYSRFVRDLRKAGVDVFDEFIPASLSPGAEPRYLMRDTHWTPEWMEEAAELLARHVQSRISLPEFSERLPMVVEAREVQSVGDLVETLKLGARQSLFPPQRVTIHRVLDGATKKPIGSNEASDVLFIGDSFSNIYSDEEMGWGDSAGLAEQVALRLGRRLDLLVTNGGAATEMRESLAGREAPLRGKRLIIWQVAMHELTASNWRVAPLKVP